jgi:protein tyrosine phosphatase (PTP) superfamily phosphohydrolase (DUF442 family)
VVLTGCGQHAPSLPVTNQAPQAKSIDNGSATRPPPAPQRKEDLPGVHNLVQVSDRIYSGSEPHGDVAFESLARLGVKTIVSVDGAKPNLEAAKQHGLQYVHIPIGYDGIGDAAGKALARVGRQAQAPIYVHCHHGQHRGPAAAAVACMAADGRAGKEALQILELAGTGKQYPGLWRDVEGYAPPAAGDKLPELSELAEVESFAAAMAKLDRNYDNLKLCRDAGWTVPPYHPDIVPAQEALILRETLHESNRNLVADRPAEFKAWLAESEMLAQELEQAVKARDPQHASQILEQLDRSCKQCHGKYRNGG